MILPKTYRTKGDKIQMNAIYNDNENLVDKTKLLLNKIATNESFSNADKDEIHQFVLNCIKIFLVMF